MAIPNVNVGELVVTTLRSRAKKLADNATHNTALLARLKQKGNVQPFNGGRSILQPITYALNGTVKRYSGYDSLNIAPQDVFTGAEYAIKQIAVAVSMSGLEEILNADAAQVLDLLRERMKNAEDSMLMTLSGDVYSDGTADSGKQINGLAALVSNTGLGVVGGIDSSVWTFWQNQVISSAGLGLGVPSSSNMQTLVNRAIMQTKRGREEVDLLVGDNNMYRFYLESLQAIQRITSTTDGKFGFSSVKTWNNADVVYDGGYHGDAPANQMYCLNTNHIKYRPAAGRDMTPLGERFSTNQDAFVKLIGWAGNLVASNRQLQVVITG
jgi:hypothetical protein